MVKLTTEEQLRFARVLTKYHVYLDKQIKLKAKMNRPFDRELFNLYSLGFIEGRFRNDGITNKEYQQLLDWEIVAEHN